jgi:hypothetical protein
VRFLAVLAISMAMWIVAWAAVGLWSLAIVPLAAFVVMFRARKTAVHGPEETKRPTVVGFPRKSTKETGRWQE